MSAIGGMISMGRQSVEPSALNEMSRAMLLRGRDQRDGYLRNRAAVFCNRRLDGTDSATRQPYSLTRKGQTYTVLFDGAPRGGGSLSSLCPALGVEGTAEWLLDAYLAYGSTFAAELEGRYALAILDEGRGELFLARDRQGSCPLFYTLDGERFAFASEIKGLLRTLTGGARVSAEALRLYWRAPWGALGAEELYRDIRAFPPGHGGILSGLGLTLFPFEDRLLPEERQEKGAVLTGELVCPDEEELKMMLTELLFAFDYPQFDHWMPGSLCLLKRARDQRKKEVILEDGASYLDITYATERADQLGAVCDLNVYVRPPDTTMIRQKELKRMDRLLYTLTNSLDEVLLSRLVGQDWREIVESEKNLARRIRMRGLLCQSALWAEHYPILLD